MLGETKQNILDCLTKIQAYDSLLISLNSMHKDHEEEAKELVKKISARKLVLISETHILLS